MDEALKMLRQRIWRPPMNLSGELELEGRNDKMLRACDEMPGAIRELLAGGEKLKPSQKQREITKRRRGTIRSVLQPARYVSCNLCIECTLLPMRRVPSQTRHGIAFSRVLSSNGWMLRGRVCEYLHPNMSIASSRTACYFFAHRKQY